MVGWSKLTALTARMVIGSMIGLRLASCLGILWGEDVECPWSETEVADD